VCDHALLDKGFVQVVRQEAQRGPPIASSATYGGSTDFDASASAKQTLTVVNRMPVGHERFGARCVRCHSSAERSRNPERAALTSSGSTLVAVLAEDVTEDRATVVNGQWYASGSRSSSSQSTTSR